MLELAKQLHFGPALEHVTLRPVTLKQMTRSGTTCPHQIPNNTFKVFSPNHTLFTQDESQSSLQTAKCKHAFNQN